MTRCLLLVIALVLNACRSDEPEAETPAPPDPAPRKSHSIENARLLNEKFTLTQQLNQILADVDLESHEQFQTLRESRRSAEDQFSEIRQNHPLLQKLNRELAHWQTRARMARSSGQSDALESANERIVKIRGAIIETSKSLPELTSAQEALDELTRQIEDLRRELAAQSPEGRAILEQIKALEAQIRSE